MNTFISEMLKTMGVPNAQKLNCCKTQGTLIDDTKVSFSVCLPDGTKIEIYTPGQDSAPSDMGYAYLPDYDIESPDMCAEDLGVWADDSLDCCKRIDSYYQSIAGREVQPLGLNCGIEKFTEDAMDPTENQRAKDVFAAACAAVDLPANFRYQGARTSNNGEYILRTLQVYSQKIGTWQWVCKSALQLSPDTETSDDWGFIPNYNPESEGHLVYHREGRVVAVEQGLYGTTISGDTPEARDKKAAYWLVGLLSSMCDSMLENPPARVYEFFLTSGLSGFSKENVMQMNKAGVIRCIQKGFLDAEKVLKARPDIARDLVEKKLIAPEVVARRSPDDLLWLVRKGLVSPDYALKINPDIRDTLTRKGLYQTAENVPDNPDEIIAAIQAGTIKPVDAYRKNPKLLQPMVEQGLITPQEAYRLDASIVTWLLLNHYIGRAEAAKIKPDIQKYIAKKYKDVNWEDLDSSDNPIEDQTLAASKKSRVASDQKLNSSAGFNQQEETLNADEPQDVEEHNEFSEYGAGYEKLADTTVEGPGYVAEVMLPEDDFDGIVVPGDSEDIAKETLMQMLLANDGTFVDWKPVADIQAFKAENGAGNFLVLN